MGLPGAGKSTIAESFVARGYQRLNRDDRGGSLAALLPAIASGSPKIVADNTYVSRKSRAAVIQTAKERGLSVRCVWADTSVEDAQVNAASRIVSRYGRLLTPEEMRRARKKDVTAFAPTVQFRYQRELEPPDPSEGFSQIDRIAFERRPEPSFTNRAVLVWCDGVLWRSRSGRRSPASADDVEIVGGCADILRRWKDEGWLLLGLLWQPEPSALRLHAGASRGFPSSSSTARTTRDHRSAGAASRFRASASCSFTATNSTHRNAFTWARDRRIRVSPDGWDFSTAKRAILHLLRHRKLSESARFPDAARLDLEVVLLPRLSFVRRSIRRPGEAIRPDVVVADPPERRILAHHAEPLLDVHLGPDFARRAGILQAVARVHPDELPSIEHGVVGTNRRRHVDRFAAVAQDAVFVEELAFHELDGAPDSAGPSRIPC